MTVVPILGGQMGQWESSENHQDQFGDFSLNANWGQRVQFGDFSFNLNWFIVITHFLSNDPFLFNLYDLEVYGWHVDYTRGKMGWWKSNYKKLRYIVDGPRKKCSD